MSRGSFRFDSFTSLIGGTATVAALVITQQVAVLAKTAAEVAEIATPITVQVNSALGDGSGVIIARQGKTYTVLTVNHVVEDSNVNYSIQTHDGENYPAIRVLRLQREETQADLAVVKFESPKEYPVATLGNSDQAVIGAQIYVYGYPATGGLTGGEREPELSPGLITSRPKNRPEGYNLRYQAVTWSGMSGGPVLDTEARIVGLHGQGEFGFAQTSSGDVAPIKTGFNAAVPINLFRVRLADAELNSSDLVIDEQGTAATPISLGNPEDAQALYFRGLTKLDQGDAWDAIADFNRALALTPNSPELYFHRAIARSLSAPAVNDVRGPNPIPDYTEAIRLNPGYADAYYNRGLAKVKFNDLPGALEDFKKAAQLYQQLGRKTAHEETLKIIQELEQKSSENRG